MTTIITNPLALAAGYNPVVYTFTSTTNTNIGFRYLFDIYDTTTTDLIARLKVIPNPTGDGYVDISKILSNYLSNSNNFSYSATDEVDNAALYYNVKIGEEYQYQLPYSSVTSASTGTYSGYVILKTSGATSNQYVAGDQINIVTVSTGNTATINGLHRVLSAGTNVVTIDVIFPSVAAPINIGGNTTYADSRKIQFSGQTNLSNTVVFNGALDWPEWKNWSASQYTITTGTSVTKQWLTSLEPQSLVTDSSRFFYMRPSQNVWMNYYTSLLTGQYGWLRTHYNKAGVSQGSIATPANILNGNLKQFKIGFDSMTVTPNEGDYMTVHLYSVASGLPVSAKYVFYADTRCNREDVQIYYQDRLGSILSQSFQLNSTQNITVDRNTVKQAIVYGTNSSLDLSEGGSVITNVDINRQYTLSTDWLTDANIELLEELITSRYVWMLVGSDYLPVLVQDKGYEITYQRNKRLQRKTITVQLANNRPIN